MSTYNTQLQSNNTDLQTVLQTLQTKAAGTENLDTEISTQSTLLSEQDAKIAELAQVLANKAAVGNENSGAEFETCTIDISKIGKDYGFGHESGTIVYTTLENGKMIAKRLNGIMDNLSINVVCNSFLLIYEGARRIRHSFSGLEVIDSLEFSPFFTSNLYCFYVTASAGETANLIIEID